MLKKQQYKDQNIHKMGIEATRIVSDGNSTFRAVYDQSIDL